MNIFNKLKTLFNIKEGSNRQTINVSSSNNSIVVTNGKMVINGEEHTVFDESKKHIILISGDVKELHVTSALNIGVGGDVNVLETNSGDVKVMGSVNNGVRSTSGISILREIQVVN